MKIVEKQEARKLRRAGASLGEIATQLQVSKGSVSLWVRDLPQPKRLRPESRRKHRLEREALLRLARAARKKARLAQPIYSGDVGRRLLRTPPGYQGTTLCGGRYVYEHRYMAEQKIGRLLWPGEVVHHINGDIHDNRPRNLKVTNQSEHAAGHRRDPACYCTIECPTCGKLFKLREKYMLWKRQHGQKRFFCSHACVSNC